MRPVYDSRAHFSGLSLSAEAFRFLTSAVILQIIGNYPVEPFSLTRLSAGITCFIMAAAERFPAYAPELLLVMTQELSAVIKIRRASILTDEPCGARITCKPRHQQDHLLLRAKAVRRKPESPVQTSSQFLRL